MLWSIDSCKNKADQHHISMLQAQVALVEVMFFLRLTADQVMVFHLIAGFSRVLTGFCKFSCSSSAEFLRLEFGLFLIILAQLNLS